MTDTPNWRNAGDYPNPADTSMDRWVWEFLRRNPVFIQEMNAGLSEQEAARSNGTLSIYWNLQPLGAVMKKWGVDLHYLPEWVNKLGLDSPVRFSRFPRGLILGECKSDGPTLWVCKSQPGTMPLEFDLTAPIPPQLERAKTRLEAMQASPEVQKLGVRTRNNEQTRMFPQYLRLLDALGAGIGRAKLAEFFTLGDDTLARQIEKAVALRDGGYRALTEK